MLTRDLERAQSGQKPYKPEWVKCAACKCEWFEILKATRVDMYSISDLGQAPQEADKFHLLRCLKCGDMQEPPLANNMMSPLRKDYDDLLDSLQEEAKTQE